jgi:hypothetical protein
MEIDVNALELLPESESPVGLQGCRFHITCNPLSTGCEEAATCKSDVTQH